VDFPSNWRSRESLDHYLERHGVAGISGIDTRALGRPLRTAGAMNGNTGSSGLDDVEALRARAAALPSMAGLNLVDGVTCAKPYEWREGGDWLLHRRETGKRYRVVA